MVDGRLSRILRILCMNGMLGLRLVNQTIRTTRMSEDKMYPTHRLVAIQLLADFISTYRLNYFWTRW